MSNKDILKIFCEVDDFCQNHASLILEGKASQMLCLPQKRLKTWKCRMVLSEIMTIMILFHWYRHRTFKDYYIQQVQEHWKAEFPHALSYNRFVEMIPSAIFALFAFSYSCHGKVTGISYIDSMDLPVCDNLRIHSNKVFEGIAKRGKHSCGWFYGFKLHLIINHKGEILSYTVTPGNIDDRKPVINMTKNLSGKLFGDKGYISSELTNELFENGIILITRIKKNMKPRLLELGDKLLLNKRNLIETVNDQLQNLMHIDHTRHRSPYNFIAHLFAGIIAYSYMPRKPHLKNCEENQSRIGLGN